MKRQAIGTLIKDVIIAVVAYAIIAVLGAVLKFIEKKLSANGADYKNVYKEENENGDSSAK